MRRFLTAFLLSLTALPTGPASAAVVPSAPRKITIAGRGLTIFVANKVPQRTLPFGMARSRIIAYLKMALGAPTGQGRQKECGPGPLDHVDFPGKLSLAFQNGAFVGWTLGNGGDTRITTSRGMTLRMTRQMLTGIYPTTTVEESSLGTEFLSQGVSGLLDGAGRGARITDMWAGSTCIAR